MDAKELFTRCIEQATKTFHQLSAADYNKPTPDTEWNIKVLANHMLYELSWVPDLLSGRTVAQVGSKYDGNLLGDKPAANWDKAAALAKAEAKLADPARTVHLSFGDYPGEFYLRQVAGDLLIHSWDLAAALGINRELDGVAAEAVYDGMLQRKSSWQNSGLFGPELEAPEGADIQSKLLALVGRNAGWQAK